MSIFVSVKIMMLNFTRKIRYLLKLYRPDVPVIIFLASFSGRLFTTGFSVEIIFEGLFLALFPYNFVYTLNSITDVVEDKINKPWRPIPSGKVSFQEAFAWLIVITVVSVAGISFYYKGWELFLAFLIIFLGISYSLPPFTIKKRAIMAPIITGWGVMHPLFITGGVLLIEFSFSIMLHAIGTTLLKDISDVEGDIQAGRKILFKNSGLFYLVCVSVFFKICSIILFQFTEFKIAAIIPAVSIVTVLFNYYYKKHIFIQTIYKKIIWMTAFSSLITISLMILSQ